MDYTVRVYLGQLVHCWESTGPPRLSGMTHEPLWWILSQNPRLIEVWMTEPISFFTRYNRLYTFLSLCSPDQGNWSSSVFVALLGNPHWDPIRTESIGVETLWWKTNTPEYFHSCRTDGQVGKQSNHLMTLRWFVCSLANLLIADTVFSLGLPWRSFYVVYGILVIWFRTR